MSENEQTLTVLVHPRAKFGSKLALGPFTEIGPTAEIGDNCILVGCTVEGRLADGVKVWRFAHVREGAVIGKNTQICNGAFINSNVTIGENCNIQLHVGISGAKLGNNVYVGPCTVFCNVRNPDTNGDPEMEDIVIEDGVSIGANVSIVAPCRIGAGSKIGAGAYVTGRIAPESVMVGHNRCVSIRGKRLG